MHETIPDSLHLDDMLLHFHDSWLRHSRLPPSNQLLTGRESDSLGPQIVAIVEFYYIIYS
jgi:hypothetical protein